MELRLPEPAVMAFVGRSAILYHVRFSGIGRSAASLAFTSVMHTIDGNEHFC